MDVALKTPLLEMDSARRERDYAYRASSGDEALLLNLIVWHKKGSSDEKGRPYLDEMHNCAYNTMRYQWNKNKAGQNFRKHGVYFADAVSVFADDLALTIEDVCSGERRWITLGRDLFGRMLVVIYSWRGDAIRIISARKADPKERRQYGKTT
jgi:uncharacterized DUF497 family protein